MLNEYLFLNQGLINKITSLIVASSMNTDTGEILQGLHKPFHLAGNKYNL